MCLNHYQLNPCHYFSSPTLSWNVMLKMTKIILELISNINMHLFIEKVMKGGISYISKRYGKANKDNKFIMYWDANNLYGWTMNQPLPYWDFNFLSKKDISEFCLNSISENSPIGYILEVDDKHSDYPVVKKLKLVQTCCQNIVVILLINME